MSIINPYKLPTASDEMLGGIKASEKTTENIEVKIDPTTGKLYVPSVDVGAVTVDTVITNSDVGIVPLTVSALEGQTANLVEFKVDDINKASIDANGNLSANTLISTVAQGTAPLSILSTTMVNNLNSEMLGGKTLGTIELDISSKVPKVLSVLNPVSYASSLPSVEKNNSYMYVYNYTSPTVSEPTRITVSEVLRPSVYVLPDSNLPDHVKIGDLVYTEISGS
jgi:hypothetical protein